MRRENIEEDYLISICRHNRRQTKRRREDEKLETFKWNAKRFITINKWRGHGNSRDSSKYRQGQILDHLQEIILASYHRHKALTVEICSGGVQKELIGAGDEQSGEGGRPQPRSKGKNKV